MKALTVLTACVLTAGAFAQASPLAPESLESFVGVSWSGIRLGATTDGDLKRTFGTQKSTFRPEAVRVRTVESAPYRIDALLDGRGDKAKVAALRLEFLGNAPTLEALEAAMGTKTLAFYPRQRFEDWSIRVFPERGIALFLLGEPPVARPAVALLMNPSRLADLTAGLLREPSDVEEYDPRFSDQELTITYGRVMVTLTGTNVDFQRKRDLEIDIEEELMGRSRARFLEYRRGSPIALNASVNVRWDTRRKTMTYDVSLGVSGRNVLGDVGASGSSSQSFSRIENRPLVRDMRTIGRLLDEARDELERNFDNAVLRQRPPSKEQIRNAIWADLTNRATRQF